MLYREAGQFKPSYAEDQQIFRSARIGSPSHRCSRSRLVVPLIANELAVGDPVPLLIFALATLGLNLLTGYAGQLSLGTAAFMAVGAFAAYNLMLRVPGIPLLVAFALAGVCAALVGIVFGLPSLRIKGFYLAVATLAAQFFVVWALTKFGWFSNHSTSGVINAQKMTILGYSFDSPLAKYLHRPVDRRCWPWRPRTWSEARWPAGWRCATWMSPRSHRHKDTAHRLLAFAISAVLLPVSPGAVRVRLSRHGEPERNPRPVVPGTVHGDHRWRRQRPGRSSAPGSSCCCRYS
jgi:hypothetical protein